LNDGRDLVVLGGQDAAHNSTAAVLDINPRTGVAKVLGALNPAVHDAAGVRLDHRDVVIAGGTPPPQTVVQAIGASGRSQIVGRLPERRTDHSATLLGATIYVFGGAQDEGVPVSSIFASGDGANWRSAGTLVDPARYPAVAVARGAAYVFGGVTTTAGTDTQSVQRYDPKTQTTTVVAELPAPLSHASAIAFGHIVFVIGGFVNNKPSAQILRFDTTTNQITDAGLLPGPLTDGAATIVHGVGYLVGGEGPGRTTSASVEILHRR
jgi:N-acetylneuraminic acid mutarotase